ncbi:MAG: hypothetical protein WC635_00850 [Bacteriovorax sp.]|jgi:hypothetical protein
MKFLPIALMVLSFNISAAELTRVYSCEILKSMEGHKNVNVSFTKGLFNSISKAQVDIIRWNDQLEIQLYDGSIKIPGAKNYDQRVYLNHENNSHINPFADAYYLMFDGMEEKFKFNELQSSILLTLKSHTGAPTNNQHRETALSCELNNTTNN